MPEAKFERDMLIVQQHWNNFISLIKKDLNELYAEKRKIVVTIKRIERIEKILQHSQDNIEFLLLHKESFTNLDTGLEQKFAILEAFKKRDNLGNAVALRTYKEILESIKVKSAIEKINYLKEKRDSLQDLIDKINNLIYGTAYDIETIVQLSQKYNLSAESRTAIIIYPVFKSSKKNVPNNQRKTDNQRNLAPTSQRKLSVEECKRLQTIPDDFDMKVISNTQAYKCIGNGWTVNVIVHLIESAIRGDTDAVQTRFC